jgi:hypothetical protein
MFVPTPPPQMAQMLADVAAGLLAQVDSFDDRVRALNEARERKDPLAWMKAAMPHAYRLPFCALHEYIVETRAERKHGLEAPRGHAKTAIGCVGLALYLGLEEHDRFDYFLNVQGSEPKALAVNLAIRLELEQNDVLRAVYGDLIGPDKWTDSLFVLKTGVVYQAASTGQKLRGTNYRLRRPNWVRLDDAYEDEDINNPDSTAKKNAWIESTLEPMLAKDRPTAYCFQGTAINDVDGLRALEEAAKDPQSGVKFKRFAAFDEAAGTVLWPELLSLEGWLRLRNEPGRSPTIFAREYLNERRDEASAIVKPSWLQGWEFDPAALKFDRDHKLLGVYLLVDPSIGKKVENDPTAMCLMLRSKYADAHSVDSWIMALVNERLTLHERITEMQRLIDAQPRERRVTTVRIEAVAGFKDFAAEAARKLRGAGVEEVDQVADKISVLESKSWHFQNRKVHISTGVPKNLRDTLYNQLTVNHPPHDDLRDAVLLGLEGGVKDWSQFL